MRHNLLKNWNLLEASGNYDAAMVEDLVAYFRFEGNCLDGSLFSAADPTEYAGVPDHEENGNVSDAGYNTDTPPD